MKKSIKIVLTILIFNIITITSVFGISQYEILSMSQTQIRNLSDSQLDNYLTQMRAIADEDSVQEAITKLNSEKLRRQNTITPSKILSMSDIEMASLADYQITNYIIQMQEIGSSEANNAKAKLENEQQRRKQTGNISDYKDYIPGRNTGNRKLTTMAGKILGVIRNIGIIVSMIALSIIGVKYMVGSVEQKAEYKRTMVPFVIGVMLLAGSTVLVKFIYDAVTSAGL